MSYLNEIHHTLLEAQTALAAVQDQCGHAANQTQAAHHTAEQLGSTTLATKIHDLQTGIAAVQQHVNDTLISIALAAHNAHEIASSAG